MNFPFKSLEKQIEESGLKLRGIVECYSKELTKGEILTDKFLLEKIAESFEGMSRYCTPFESAYIRVVNNPKNSISKYKVEIYIPEND